MVVECAMNRPLYEISEQYLTVLDDLLGCDEVTIADTMEGLGLEDDFKSKALNVASYFLSVEAECLAIKSAENRMLERRKSKEAHIARLKDYLLQNMVRTGITAIESPEFSVKLAKCPPSVVIDDIELLPDSLLRVKKEADKTLIKKFIEENGLLDGAHLVTDKMRLAIK
jgi:Siphovirus Gp157